MLTESDQIQIKHSPHTSMLHLVHTQQTRKFTTVTAFLKVKLGDVLPETLGIFVQLRTDNAGERTGVLSVNVFLVRSEMIPSREALHALLALI